MRKFSKEEVYESTLNYFKGDELVTRVWIDKYCLKNLQGEYMELSPDDMHHRLAKEFARIEQKYLNPLSEEEIYDLLKDFKFVLPGGSLLYGIGNNYSYSSLGNCFVIGNTSDSYGGILQTDQEQAQLMKRRAGVGHDLSHLRPEFTPVTNAAGTSTGAISFMDRYSNTTREVGQNNRRGALMLTLDINHPDIEKFITSKDDLTKITGANISVKVTDEFMKAVENDENYELYFETKWKNGSWKSFYKTVKAKELWNKLIHQATKTAEPGVLFFDTALKEDIPSCYGNEWIPTATNPCGEIFLCPYDSCRLMSVNLYSFVKHPFTNKAYFNYDKFKDITYKAQRLMDDVVDLEEEKINAILNKIENDPEPEEIKLLEKNLWIKIKSKLIQGRRTGLSSIGLADCFAGLNITYGSSESITLAEKIYKQFAISAYKSSVDMAKERGAFPIWNLSKEYKNPFIERMWEAQPVDFYNQYVLTGRRNIALLTIPPSGTISQLSNLSSGIEPVYQLYYKRRYKILENTNEKKAYDFVDQSGDKWKEYIILHPKFNEWLSINDINNVPLTEMKLAVRQFPSLENIQSIIKQSPYHKSTAYEIDPTQRVKLQATIQKWIDHSISSTINLPKGTTEEEVSNLYMEAWKQGCKGITCYVEDSRTGVLVSVDKKEEEFKQHDAPKRPTVLSAEIYIVKSKGKEWLVVVGIYKFPYEIFAVENKWNIRNTYNVGEVIKRKKGIYDLLIKDDLLIENFLEEISDEENNLTRMISTSLRHGANIKFIVEQLNKSRGDITSFAKVISRILKKYIKDKEYANELCPECNSKLIYESGCKTCKNCGWNKC